MKTYILFLFGSFQDTEDIEYFCMEVLGESGIVDSLKYVIDNLNNIIVIFDSNVDEKKLISEIDSLLNNNNMVFYFLFPKESIIGSYIPESMRTLIFKPNSDILRLELNLSSDTNNDNLNLDTILDKIKKFGVETLTPSEKKFLDNFEK